VNLSCLTEPCQIEKTYNPVSHFNFEVFHKEPGFIMQKPGWQKKVIIGLVLVVFVTCAGLAWAAEPLVLTQKDSGRTLTLPAGKSFVVDLNLGAGHHMVAPEFDPFVLTLVGQSVQSTSGPKGASSRVVYQFLVRQAGQTELVIATKGDGGKEGKPEPLLKVKIVATGGGRAV
jgi:hypothetical protein